jgi:hypothetical protein
LENFPLLRRDRGHRVIGFFRLLVDDPQNLARSGSVQRQTRRPRGMNDELVMDAEEVGQLHHGNQANNPIGNSGRRLQSLNLSVAIAVKKPAAATHHPDKMKLKTKCKSVIEAG